MSSYASKPGMVSYPTLMFQTSRPPKDVRESSFPEKEEKKILLLSWLCYSNHFWKGTGRDEALGTVGRHST
jgi:hypothetical protein